MDGFLDGPEGCRKLISHDASVGRGPYRTVDCFLKGFQESHKAEMAASSVLLGLTPVLVSQLQGDSRHQKISTDTPKR